MGALIIANSCNNNCQDCFNQHLKTAITYNETASEILDKVAINLFNDGIILGGLEWSEQPEDTIELIQRAKEEGLQVMLYTGLDKDDLFKRVPREFLVGCYVKFGKYDNNKLMDNYLSKSVRLASTNQYIEYIK